jgi:curved DNA-binding protein CbpA
MAQLLPYVLRQANPHRVADAMIATERKRGANVHYTHYDYLDLPPGASPARVEAAYHTIRQRLNGDVDPELVRLIHAAYAVLSNTDLRQDYDAQLRRIEAQADAELKALLDAHAARPPRRAKDSRAQSAPLVGAWAA